MLIILLITTSTVLAQDIKPRQVIADHYARMRSEPSVLSPTLHQFEVDTPVNAYGFDGLYWRIQFRGLMGYIINSGIQAEDRVRHFYLALPDSSIPDPTPEELTKAGATTEQKKGPFLNGVEPETVNQSSGWSQPQRDEQPVEVRPTESGGVAQPSSVDIANDTDTTYSAVSGVIAVSSFETPAQAPAGIGFIFRTGVGLSVPVTPPKVTDGWSQGLSFMASVGYGLGTKTELGLEYTRNRLTLNKDSVLNYAGQADRGFELEGGDLTISTAMAFVKVNLISPDVGFSPYILFGGGYFNFNPSNISIIGEEDGLTDTAEDDFLYEKAESVAGFTLGVGLDLRLGSPVYLFLEARGVFGVTELEGTLLTPLRFGLVLR